MSALLGADTRRVDLIAEALRGHSQDIQDLRSMAERAVAALRSSWAGPDFESIAQPWEQQAGPRLTDVATALVTMAGVLRAAAEQQRQTSGSLGAVTIGTTAGDHTDTASSTFLNGREVGTAWSVTANASGEGGRETTRGQAMVDSAKLTVAQGDHDVDASLASLVGGDDGSLYELSVGKVESAAHYSAALDAHGNLAASAGASAATYAGYAAGTMRRGSDVASGTVGGKAYVGAHAKAESSGSIGPGGAKGHLGAEAFAGATAEVEVSGTVAGLTAASGAEISYGIGAHAEADAELSVTKVGVSVDVGATLGIGAGVTFDVSVSPQEVIAGVDQVACELGDAARDVGEGLAVAKDQVDRFFDW